jgi:6-phosphogluconolactonase
VVVLADDAAVAREATLRTVDGLRTAIDARGYGHLALTGGSSAISLYRELADREWHTAVAWDRVHLWWGDERYVPTDHPESNAGLAYRVLLASAAWAGESGTGAAGEDVEAGAIPALPVPVDNVHPIDTEDAIGRGGGAEWAAARYAEQLAQYLPAGPGGVPAFDVFLTGVGPDGHTLSVFPNSPALADDAPLVMAIPAPDHVEPHLARVTLSPKFLNGAAQLIVMCTGEAKADVIAQILGKDRDVARWPAQAAIVPNAVWLLDEAAAAKLGA